MKQNKHNSKPAEPESRGSHFSRRIVLNLLLMGILALTVSSCASRKDVQLGDEAVQKKEWGAAVKHYLRAVGKDPDNVEYRVALSNALISASNIHLQRGERFRKEARLNLAVVEFDKALEYNPENNEARIKKHIVLKSIREQDRKRREKTQIQQVKERSLQKKLDEPKLNYKKKPFSLKFINSDIKQIFKVMQKISGVNFLYEGSFKSKKVELNMEDVYFQDALEKIMLEINCFYKIIDENTVLIIPDNPAKRKYFEDLITKTFFLSNGDPENVMKIVRGLTAIKNVVVNKELSALSLKGTPEEVALAEKIIYIHDKPKGELYIDIEIIEVNKNRTNEYGIELSSYQVTEAYSPVGPEGTSGVGSTGSSIRFNQLKYTDGSDFLLTLPAINYKLLKYDSDSKIKARPQLRVVDQEEVKVRLGDKVPIPTTNFVPYNTGGPAQQPITSYQMQDIGINITITPRIHHDGLITLKMEFELTFITSPGEGGIPPTIGNRSVTTVIKLRDSETSMLAGLLRDTERKSIRGFPGLSQLPILKEIFSANKKEVEQTDIILTLTPRIVRFPEINDGDLDAIWSGTLLSPGLRPPRPKLRLKDETEIKTVPEATGKQPDPTIKPVIQPAQKTTPPKRPLPIKEEMEEPDPMENIESENQEGPVARDPVTGEILPPPDKTKTEENKQKKEKDKKK